MQKVRTKTCRDCGLIDDFDNFPVGRSRCGPCLRKHMGTIPSGTRESRVRRKYRDRYSLELEQVQAVYETQDGKCAICELELPPILSYTPVWQSAVVDHDHSTGHLRGLLCSACNLMIGHAKDDTNILHNGIVYLASRAAVHQGREFTDEEAYEDGKEDRQGHGRVQGGDPA